MATDTNTVEKTTTPTTETQQILTDILTLACTLSPAKKISITWELWIKEEKRVTVEVYVHYDGQVHYFEDALSQHRDVEVLLHRITRG